MKWSGLKEVTSYRVEGLIDPGTLIIKSKIFIGDRRRISRSLPQNRCSFLLDRAIPPAKKRGCCKTAKLQGQNPFKSVRWKKHSFKSVFFVSVDTVFTDQKNTFVRLPKGAFYGLI